ncbi:hypothetical protein GQ457_12G001540 [Hibiscus cannabinus]
MWGQNGANMQLRSNGGDGFRVSVSSTPSCVSSGSAGPDDIESLGDLNVWGVVWSDGVMPDGHVALLTKLGEIFTLGDDSGGRLGHGIEKDFCHPRLVEFLALTNVEFVASGEYHTCGVSASGDLFTWGDATHNAGILGLGTDMSHWIPKRVSGAIEALATSDGKLFTFGDGKFGVLGHGDRENVMYPKEVQMLSGLKTVKVACGVWHTAAIVEVMCQSGANKSSRKLFTWDDGDKHRLGHGNSLQTYYIRACLYHSGTAYGQLGNPNSDGKLPCLVQEKLVGVEEISCGAYHVAVLTSRTEVFTWGRGANGRLGHGDIEDRKTPTLVEALRDMHVKNISCGLNFTSSICIHKWFSGPDHSKKAVKAALAPTPGKPHRVCDSCYAKLKAAEACNTSTVSRKLVGPRSSIDGRERSVRFEVRPSRILLYPRTEPVKSFEIRSGKLGSKFHSMSLVRAAQVPSLLQLKDIAFPSSLTAVQSVFKPAAVSPPLSNELLNQEVAKLQNQIKSMKQRSDSQDAEILKLRNFAQQSTSYAAKESSKSKEAKALMKFIKDQLMEIKEKLPPEVSESEAFKAMQAQAEAFLNRLETF